MNTLQQERIETPRLALVPLEEATARAVLAGDLSTLDHAEGWPHADTLDAVRMALRAEAPWPVWLVVADGVVIGDCGTLGDVDGSGDVEIGLGLAKEHRGRGYGTEVIEALSGWLLRRPTVRRVVAREVEADNHASRRALEKAGFVLERAEGDAVSYALAKSPNARPKAGG